MEVPPEGDCLFCSLAVGINYKLNELNIDKSYTHENVRETIVNKFRTDRDLLPSKLYDPKVYHVFKNINKIMYMGFQ